MFGKERFDEVPESKEARMKDAGNPEALKTTAQKEFQELFLDDYESYESMEQTEEEEGEEVEEERHEPNSKYKDEEGNVCETDDNGVTRCV